MKKETVLGYEEEVECNECHSKFSVFSDFPDEGFGHASLFYECSSCNYPYSHTISDETYLGSVQEKIKEIKCVNCKENLSQTLKKAESIGVCPQCSAKHFTRLKSKKEGYVNVTNIYHENA